MVVFLKKILLTIVSILFVALLGNCNVSAKEVLMEPEVYDFPELRKYVVERFRDLLKLDGEGKLYITDISSLILNESNNILRHTYASYMISKNVHFKILQEQLEHTDIKQTLNTYSHLTEQEKIKASDLFDEIL